MPVTGVPSEAAGLSPEVWFPVVTLVAGALIGAFTQILTDRRTAHRERIARLEQRQDAARTRRIEFQRVTLLELQDRAGDLARSAAKTFLADEAAHRETGVWRQNLVGEDVSNEFFIAQTTVVKLRERVLDDQVRELTTKLRDACVNTEQARSKDNAFRWLSQVSDLLRTLNVRIGEELRSLDSIEDEYTK
ncbi:hypothetical protein ACWGTO_07530 [Mesorhizobium sp. PL10]